MKLYKVSDNEDGRTIIAKCPECGQDIASELILTIQITELETQIELHKSAIKQCEMLLHRQAQRIGYLVDAIDNLAEASQKPGWDKSYRALIKTLSDIREQKK